MLESYVFDVASSRLDGSLLDINNKNKYEINKGEIL